jgi:hypothetical protein
MSYYILKPAVDTQETGNAYPAVESYDDYNFNAPNSVHKLKSREFPDFNPDMRFKLAKGAKLCDMMGQATINAHGFLISEKLKSIFENANLVPNKFYPATIEEAKGILHNYYWMHLVWNEGIDIIDYANSSFFVRRGLRNIGKIEVNSFDDFNAKNNEMGAVNYIDYDKILLKEPIAFDAFPIYHGVDIFISEAMANALKNHKLSGLDIIITNKISLNLQS